MGTEYPLIIDAIRTPLGKRRGALSTMHAADLLGSVHRAIFDRNDLDPANVGQVLGGCVSQIGEQSFNITRTAWLGAGLPHTVAASTVDAQCGSGQQALNIAAALVKSGITGVAIGCGVESMSRVPIGSNSAGEFGRPINRQYRSHYEYTSQFQAAELIAKQWGITRDDADELGALSQARAAKAWANRHFDTQLVTVHAPIVDAAGKPTGATVPVDRDEGLRETSRDALAQLKPVGHEDAIHTAGTSSQISDGAAAVLLADESAAEQFGLRPRARILDTILLGVDPVTMLTGPIDVTDELLQRHGLKIDDIDVVEINEAFASVVLAWLRATGADIDRVNPNGGAIALGHPLGATGAALVAKTLAELERTNGRYGLVTMCCGGGLGTGTLIERLG